MLEIDGYTPAEGATATGRTGRTKVAVRSGRVAMFRSPASFMYTTGCSDPGVAS